MKNHEIMINKAEIEIQDFFLEISICHKMAKNSYFLKFFSPKWWEKSNLKHKPKFRSIGKTCLFKGSFPGCHETKFPIVCKWRPKFVKSMAFFYTFHISQDLFLVFSVTPLIFVHSSFCPFVCLIFVIQACEHISS